MIEWKINNWRFAVLSDQFDTVIKIEVRIKYSDAGGEGLLNVVLWSLFEKNNFFYSTLTI